MNKNIIVRQQDLKDCGVCSLLSIIKYYDGFIPIEKLRVDTMTSLEGTTAYHLVKAARNYGFDSYGIKLEKIQELEQVILPAIAHITINGLNHFIVIYNITKSEIIAMDPAKGKVKIKKSEFETMWTNHLIILHPKSKLPKITTTNYLRQMIFLILKKEKKNILKILFLTTFFTIFTILSGFYFKIGTNILLESEEKNIVITIIILFLFIYLIKIVLYYLRNYFKILLNKRMDGILYYQFLNHLFLLPNYFLKDRTNGEIMIRLKELENIKEVYSEILITILLDSILSFSVGIILYHLNKTLFFILCLFVLIYVIIGLITSRILYKKAIETNDTEVAFHSNVLENIDSCITLKNLNRIPSSLKKIEINLVKYLTNLYHLSKTVLKSSTINFFLEEMLTFSIISFGLIEIINKNFTIIDLITFESLITFFINPFKNAINVMPNYNYVKVGLNKMNDFYNVPEEKSEAGWQEFQNGSIVIEHLNFSYNHFSKLFEDFNIKIKENDFVLFKGKSGCGKSTLCQMICRLVEVEGSSIKIRNRNINDYSMDTIRKNITYVSQKETLMQDTIKNNILLDREISEEKWHQIISLCEIEEIVDKKPLRYETFLTKDSINISGGERQRIILARALLNDFQILILDEALSEVNNELEIKIIKKLKKYYENKTVIYVSHKEHDQYFKKVYRFGE